MKTIIIDDEKLARDLIRNFLQSFDNIEIVDECDNGFEGIKSINEHNPDLIFLDIQMPKLTGFEMLELLENPHNIIFTTAYDQYALKAFEVNAVDYLLKPFSRERFAEAVNKVIEKIGNSNNNDKHILSHSNFIQSDEKLSRIVVKKGNKIVVLPIDNIKYLEAQDDYVNIISTEGSFLKQNRMKYYEEHLPDSFIRIHRSYIVNLNEIKEISLLEKDSHIVILKSGEKLPVSKNGYIKLKEVIR
ncbi:MAG: LytTR family transcriptional regulator DNA-binding domain-containing protein [Bacteroidetes bacterium]|nr:LytTR family transcriptional regulator DNA-binding domain-containing protein [Bacteroidota bacterium]MBU1116214.1 LytTR family transcriptional regulator DNA-binding domain-containing protein [Bacteroidota bacterium]MBU1798588.1 LytTR family transcriptional regulator DNA-binding domain-containing protein [Bacteroidota bacterium]